MFATLSPTYMGIAQAGLRFHGGLPACRGARHAAREAPHVPHQADRGGRDAHQAGADAALFLQNARDARVDPDKDTRMRLYAAHYTIMENANALAALAIRTCGGQSMLKSLPLERLYRDSRCGSLMLPWTAELCVDRLGPRVPLRKRRARRSDRHLMFSTLVRRRWPTRRSPTCSTKVWAAATSWPARPQQLGPDRHARGL